MKLRIKELLKDNGMTAVSLANEVGITNANMSRIINEKIYPSFQTLEKIASALTVPITELFHIESKTELTALVEHRNEFYKAETLEGLKDIVRKIEQKTPHE